MDSQKTKVFPARKEVPIISEGKFAMKYRRRVQVRGKPLETFFFSQRKFLKMPEENKTKTIKMKLTTRGTEWEGRERVQVKIHDEKNSPHINPFHHST